jgi:hypothetical protein
MQDLPLSKKLRRIKLGLQTLFGSRPGGYFIPYRYAADTEESVGRPVYPVIDKMFEDALPEMKNLLAEADQYTEIFDQFDKATPPDPRWQQGWFPRLDGMMAYTLTRKIKPARLVEIGSGHSTRFYYRAVRDGDLKTAIHAIDPAPRADITKLPISIERTIVQKADPDIFDTLADGDILSIDSSHILMPGTDVDLLFSTVVPALPAGVVIHIHDICLPLDYPAAWRWRGYNEQQGVAALLGGGQYDVLWSSAYANRKLKYALELSCAANLPMIAGAIETSLWIRKRS